MVLPVVTRQNSVKLMRKRERGNTVLFIGGTRQWLLQKDGF
jgi:hypothetical protein